MAMLHKVSIGWSNLLLLLSVSVWAAPPAQVAEMPARPQPMANRTRVLLAPELETTLASAMAGRIAAIDVGLGDSFSLGQALLRFDCNEQQARLDMAMAELDSARQIHESKRRLMELKQAGKVEVAIAAANVEKVQAEVKLLRVQLDYCTVKAPFDGRVVKVGVKAYQGVQIAQPLLEIVSAGPLKLRINVPAKWINWLKVGTPFQVAIDETGKTYQARTSAINARIDAVSQTIEIEAAIVDKSPELLPGMSGTALLDPPS